MEMPEPALYEINSVADVLDEMSTASTIGNPSCVVFRHSIAGAVIEVFRSAGMNVTQLPVHSAAYSHVTQGIFTDDQLQKLRSLTK